MRGERKINNSSLLYLCVYLFFLAKNDDTFCIEKKKLKCFFVCNWGTPKPANEQLRMSNLMSKMTQMESQEEEAACGGHAYCADCDCCVYCGCCECDEEEEDK